jgi:hypothetical protein
MSRDEQVIYMYGCMYFGKVNVGNYFSSDTKGFEPSQATKRATR